MRIWLLLLGTFVLLVGLASPLLASQGQVTMGYPGELYSSEPEILYPGGLYEIEPAKPDRRLSRAEMDSLLRAYRLPSIMRHVAQCESGRHVLTISKTSGKYGRDYGLLQINWYWWNEDLREKGISSERLDLLDLETNMRATKHIYRSMGLDAWFPSEHCWSKYV